MSDLLEAIENERQAEADRHAATLASEEENHRARLALLDEAEGLARSLNGGDPTSASPPQAQRPKSPPKRPAKPQKRQQAKKDSPPKAPDLPPPPLKEPPGQRTQKTRDGQRADAILLHLKSYPESSMGEIIEQMAPTYKEASVRATVKRLQREGKIRVIGERRWTRYSLTDDDRERDPEAPPTKNQTSMGKRDTKPATSPDGDGARTEQERKVVEALRDGPRPAAGLGVKLKMRLNDLDRILASLVVRGVLVRYKERDVAAPLFKIKGT